MMNMDMLSRASRRTLAALITVMWVAPVMAQPLSDDAASHLLQRLDDLEHDVSTLRGENERLRNDLTDIQKNQPQPEKPKSDTASTSTPSAPAASTPSSTVNDSAPKTDPNSYYSYGSNKSDDKNVAAKPIDASTTASKPADKPADTGSTPAPSATSSTASTSTSSTALPKSEERAAYDDAFQLLLKSPKDALPAFRKFLKDYPSSPLAASAQYWVGEALYSDKDFKTASEEFLVVLKNYKGSEKAPDAALKLGYCFYELKDFEKARKTLEDVIKFFPGKDAANLAKDRLDKMKTEGH